MQLWEQASLLVPGAVIVGLILLGIGVWVGRRWRRGSKRHRPTRRRASRIPVATAKRKLKSK